MFHVIAQNPKTFGLGVRTIHTFTEEHRATRYFWQVANQALADGGTITLMDGHHKFLARVECPIHPSIALPMDQLIARAAEEAGVSLLYDMAEEKADIDLLRTIHAPLSAPAEEGMPA
jgi:hypothetical protein